MPKKHPRRLFLRIFYHPCGLLARSPLSALFLSLQIRRLPDDVRPSQACSLDCSRNFVSPLQAKKIRYRKFCDTSFFSVDFLFFLTYSRPTNKSSQCAFFRLPCSRSYEQIFPVSFQFFHCRALRPNLLLLICKIISKK